MTTKAARTATPMCPLRPGEPCMLCQPGGPESCGLVYLVMTDPVLRDDLARRTAMTATRRVGDDRWSRAA